MSGSMEVRSKNIEMVSVSELTPHPKNMNSHPEDQINRLCKLIEYQGFRNPLVVQKGTNLIVAGHGRLEAAKKLGIVEVPVTYQEFESEAQLYAYMVSDNAIASWSDLDISAIDLEVKDLDLDIDLLGIKDFELTDIEELDPQTDEDEVPEVKEEPITKRGDVWLLGNHRVMCGDSTMIDDVEKLMNGEKADMVFTDPPYGMFLDTNYDKMFSNDKNHKKTGDRFEVVKGDHADFDPDFINNIFGLFGYCKEMFLWGADYYSEHLVDKNRGSWVCWDKRCTENMDKVMGNTFELCWSKAKHKRVVARVMWSGHHGMAKDDTKKRVHPTQKPVELIEWFFKQYPIDDAVKTVDLFLGSGSTLIACEKTNRKCYGMELDEHYCDVIINRWQNYTGKKATLESNDKTYDELKNVG